MVSKSVKESRKRFIMVKTSTRHSTDNLAFTIREALQLCEVAEYSQAADLLPPADLRSFHAELLFVWGVIASGEGHQEEAKDLLSKAVRLLPGDRASLARVYLSLCYWRLGELSEASVLLSLESFDPRSLFCSLLTQAIIATEQSNELEALTLLSEAESLLEDVSRPARGKFYNQRALAKAKLGEYEEAIRDFEVAFDYWKDAPALWVLAKNNISRTYSKMGHLETALASVNEAISLTTNRQLLGQFHDQKSKIFCDHSRIQEANIESQRALSLLAGTERQDFFIEAIETRTKLGNPCQMPESVLERPSSEITQEGGAASMATIPLTVERSTEILDTLTVHNDNDNVKELIELIVGVGDPEKARRPLRHLFSKTPDFEDAFQQYMGRFTAIDATDKNH